MMTTRIYVLCLLAFTIIGCNGIEDQEIGSLNEIDTVNYDNLYVDPRDGKSYRTKVIDGRLWMLDNLGYAVEQSLLSPANKDTRYYNWSQAMRACPPGWKLPSKLEVESLKERQIDLKKEMNVQLEGYFDQSLDTLVFRQKQAGFWTQSATLLYIRQDIQNQKGEDSIVSLDINIMYQIVNSIYGDEEYIPEFVNHKKNKSIEEYQAEWEYGKNNKKPILYDYLAVDSTDFSIKTPKPWLYLNCRCVSRQ